MRIAVGCDHGGFELKQAVVEFLNANGYEYKDFGTDVYKRQLLEIEPGLEWALFIAYNRGKLNHIKNTALYERFKSMAEGYDLIVGYIANDRMFVAVSYTHLDVYKRQVLLLVGGDDFIQAHPQLHLPAG